MPDHFDVPDWMREPPPVNDPQDDWSMLSRSELRRRRSEEQRRSSSRRSGRARGGTRDSAHPSSRRDVSARGAVGSDQVADPPLSRAELRRRQQTRGHRSADARERATVRSEPVPSMVPPGGRRATAVTTSGRRDATTLRSHGDAGAGRDRREATSRTQPATRSSARRRIAAALVLTTALAGGFWSLWPSGESSAPERSAADVGAAALTRMAAAPQPATESLTAAPSVAPPAGVQVVKAGTGKTKVVALPAIAAPTVNPGRTVRVGFRVEGGLGIDATEVAAIISDTLGDKRGWQTHDRVRFRAASPEAVADGNVDITLVLASPELTDELCAPLKTRGEVSCFNERRVVLNAKRWQLGVDGYAGRLGEYRQYLVNHEVGHGLFHGHVECPGKGKVAPIMLQQTKGLDGCKPNAWPTVD